MRILLLPPLGSVAVVVGWLVKIPRDAVDPAARLKCIDGHYLQVNKKTGF